MLTPSTMHLPLGTVAPDFTLPDPDGRKYNLKQVRGEKATLVIFACNHCPYVVHVRKAVAAIARDYVARGFAIVAINSNDIVNYPADSPDKMKKFAVESGWHFPYLFDETQQTARDYHAACTPDFFLFDGDLKLAYRGQLDDSRPGNDKPVTGSSLRAAIDEVLSGKPVSGTQRPSSGCNIKWK